jgi:uncharacterized membrane protein YgdD (TMEM256/DUF423 family)
VRPSRCESQEILFTATHPDVAINTVNSMLTPRSTLVLAALLGALGVAAGAFGSHVLTPILTSKALGTWSTGVTYLQLHALYLLVLGWVGIERDSRPFALARTAGAVGVGFFSGSLMVLALTGQTWLGAVAPVGGTALIVSWSATAWAAGQLRKVS